MAAVAQSRIQDDVHPLLRHPRPIKRDSAKAQRMLGLIADSDEKAKELQRERSLTTKWLERPMYQHLELSDIESEKTEAEDDSGHDEVLSKQSNEKTHNAVREPVRKPVQEHVHKPVHEQSREESDADLLDRWTNPDRPTSINPETVQLQADPTTRLDTSFVKRRPRPLDGPRPVSHNHLLSPEWTASPSTMSPNTAQQRASSYLNNTSPAASVVSSTGSAESVKQLAHPQTWPSPCTQCKTNANTERPVSFQPQSSASLARPQLPQRTRPSSFANYHQRKRSGGKIASSRGLRNNSYPNFSKPQVSDAAAKAVPGEHMENDLIYQHYGDDEVGPPSPTSPASPALPASPFPAAPIELEHVEDKEKDKTEKKLRNRWSTIPLALKKLAVRRRSSATAQEPQTFEPKIDDLCRLNLTQDNLEFYEKETSLAASTPRHRSSGVDLLPTPVYSPFDATYSRIDPNTQPTNKSNTRLGPLPLPFAPWTDVPLSPVASVDRRPSSGTSSLSPTRRPAPAQLSVESLSQVRPLSMHSHRSSIVISSPPSTAPQRLSMFGGPVSPRTSRLGTPIPEPTCILCKTSKPHSEFVNRRITSNCWHEPATCLHCLQTWINNCINTQGWDRCACPECGDKMSHADIEAFMGEARSLR